MIKTPLHSVKLQFLTHVLSITVADNHYRPMIHLGTSMHNILIYYFTEPMQRFGRFGLGPLPRYAVSSTTLRQYKDSYTKTTHDETR